MINSQSRWNLGLRLRRCEQGMSLTEMMIALGISGALLLLFATYMRQLSGAQERSESLNGLSRELTNLRTTLTDGAVCSNAFTGLGFDPALSENSVPVARLANLNVSFFHQEHVNITRASFTSHSKMDSMVSGGVTFDRYLAMLSVKSSLASQDDGAGGAGFKDRSVPMIVVVNSATNQIIGCDSNFDVTAEYCTLVGGVFDSAKYPKCQLPVFKIDCSGNKVASGVDPNGVICSTYVTKTPAGPKTKPNPVPVSVPFIYSFQIGCNNSPACSCPTGASEVTRSAAVGGLVLCSGFTYAPPGKSVLDVAACWDWQTANFPNDNSGLRMIDGTIVKHGFGPARQCPF